MAGPKFTGSRPKSTGTTSGWTRNLRRSAGLAADRGNFVPTVRLNPSRVTDMRAQTGPRMVMRMRIRSQGGMQRRISR